MIDKKKEIIRLYEQKEYKHPLETEIAKKVKVSRQYVHQILKIYKLQNAAFGMKK